MGPITCIRGMGAALILTLIIIFSYSPSFNFFLSSLLFLTYLILVIAPEAIAGGKDVVKINPGAKLLTKSIIDFVEDIYPPMSPKAFAKVQLIISI